MPQEWQIKLFLVSMAILFSVLLNFLPYLLLRRGLKKLQRGSRSLFDLYTVFINGVVIAGVSIIILVYIMMILF